jgi:hypothetical protein
MDTKYTLGFLKGVDYSRNQVLEFLNAHHDLGDILTFEEIIEEVKRWETTDLELLRGLSDGRLALKHVLEEGADICEDCFGSDLCNVCEGVRR